MGAKSRGNWMMGCWRKGSCANNGIRCNECDKSFSEYLEYTQEKTDKNDDKRNQNKNKVV